MLWIDQPLLLLNGEVEIFFKPVQLYFQLSDLLIQLRDEILTIPVLLATAIREDLGNLLQELFIWRAE
jgi:hypothetical protein